MSRRRTALIALAAIALSGCATFDNTDVVASVGDAELSEAELERRVLVLDEIAQASNQPSRVNESRLPGDLARLAIAGWIDLRLGAEADIVDAYLRGPVESGISCLFFIAAPDVATSDGWIDQLRGGEDWEVIVAQSPLETQLNGQTPCFPTSELDASLLDQMGGMSADDPYRTLDFGNGAAGLARMQTLDELNGSELLAVAEFVEPASAEAVASELLDVDVEVSALYGQFNAADRQVVPLG